MVIELVALIYWLLQSIIIYLNRLCCPSLTRRPHRLALNLQVLLSRQTLNRTNNTLHLIGIVSAKSFVLILLFSIFIDPLCPIHLDILIFLGAFNQSRPKGSIIILLLQDKKHMEASFMPFGFFCNNLIKQFQLESILFVATFSLESKVSGSKINILIGDVHKMYFNEDSIFSLSPFGSWMSKYKDIYSMKLKY